MYRSKKFMALWATWADSALALSLGLVIPRSNYRRRGLLKQPLLFPLLVFLLRCPFIHAADFVEKPLEESGIIL